MVPGEAVSGAALLSPALGLAGPADRRVTLRFVRGSGDVAELGLELPLSDPKAWTAGGAQLPSPRSLGIHYTEHDAAGELTFEAALISGTLELPSSPSCPCQDVDFTLRVVDAGDDGKLRTTDDQLRQLEVGVIALGGLSSPCSLASNTPRSAALAVIARGCDGVDGGAGTGAGTGAGAGGSLDAGRQDRWLGSGGNDGSSSDRGGRGKGSGGRGGGSSSKGGLSLGSGGGGGCSDSGGCDSGGGGCDGDGGGGGCAGDGGGGCGAGGGGCGGSAGGGCGGAGSTAACRIGRQIERLPNPTLLLVLLGLIGARLVRRHR